MSGCKWLWWVISITILINISTVGWAGIRFAEKPTLVYSKKNWRLFTVNFRVDKDYTDPKTERNRPFKWEVGLYDSQNKFIKPFPGFQENLLVKNGIVKQDIEVSEVGKYRITVRIQYADKKDCRKGHCSQIHDVDLFEVKRPRSKIYALIIGIDHYKDDSIANLHFPDDDADSIEQFLVGVLGVPRKQIKKLTSKEASRSNIVEAIRDFRVQVSSEDILIVYYSGHGVLYRDKFYFAPYDSIKSFDMDWFNYDAYISLESWSEYLRTQAKYLILIQDSCFAGCFIKESVGIFWNNYWAKDFGSRTRHAILASLPSQQAYEVYLDQKGDLKFATQTYPTPENKKVKGHGLFTYALLHAIEQIVAEKKIEIDLNHDRKCGETPCLKAEENVSSKVKENNIEIGLFRLYTILADYMEKFVCKHKNEMKQMTQEPMYSGFVVGKGPFLKHYELLNKGQ
jgi:hypothetical protein